MTPSDFLTNARWLRCQLSNWRAIYRQHVRAAARKCGPIVILDGCVWICSSAENAPDEFALPNTPSSAVPEQIGP
ncbi:hypothetical protein, partial [Rhizobium sp. BT-175]|uniref:hypothetical protein n=1 Tax=Rhizobium sp. BT-175 TaxID=2986929 RepID=UPI002235D772